MSRGPLGEEMVTLDDGRVLPMKKTICIPHGNKLVPAGPRVKLTAKLREEAETDEMLMRVACQNGAVENLREQIEKGTDVNNRCYANGATPLICAAVKGSHECCKMLLDAGANPHYANVSVDTALMCAVQWGHQSIVELLLEHGVDPRMWNDSARPTSPLDLCDEYDRKDIKDVIIRYWAKYDERDKKKQDQQEAKTKRQEQRHKAEVSRNAEAKRQAEAGGKPLSSVRGLSLAAVEVS